MAIERKPATPIEGTIEQEPEEELEILIENPESVAIDTEDGGMIIDFDPSSGKKGESEFNSNLTEYLDEDELDSIPDDKGSGKGKKVFDAPELKGTEKLEATLTESEPTDEEKEKIMEEESKRLRMGS